jgi:hypothetical protein
VGHEQHWMWILIGGIAAAPVWVVFGIVVWIRWLGKRLHDQVEDWVNNWPDYI